MNELALFAGAGGGILGGFLLGWTTVAAVEIEKYPRECLLQRQRDGILHQFPIWDDVRTFDGKPWRGLVDVVSGGFPCQDISCAGKGAGIDGARSGLWAEMFRIICEVRPRYAFMENSPMLTSRGLHRVLGNLAEAGYHAVWMVLGAADVGAPHRRDRIWILAEDSQIRNTHSGNEATLSEVQRYLQTSESGRSGRDGAAEMAAGSASSDADPHGMQCSEQGEQHKRSEESARGGQNRLEPGGDMAHTNLSGREKQRKPEPTEPQQQAAECGGWWSSEPSVGRVAHGVARRVDRLKAIGNGQVPLVAATAFCLLKKTLERELSHGRLVKTKSSAHAVA